MKSLKVTLIVFICIIFTGIVYAAVTSSDINGNIKLGGDVAIELVCVSIEDNKGGSSTINPDGTASSDNCMGGIISNDGFEAYISIAFKVPGDEVTFTFEIINRSNKVAFFLGNPLTLTGFNSVTYNTPTGSSAVWVSGALLMSGTYEDIGTVIGTQSSNGIAPNGSTGLFTIKFKWQEGTVVTGSQTVRGSLDFVLKLDYSKITT